jgi:hypothetical protein
MSIFKLSVFPTSRDYHKKSQLPASAKMSLWFMIGRDLKEELAGRVDNWQEWMMESLS